LLLVVPKAMQREIIKQIHDQDHFATRKVEQLLRKEFWFTCMREKVEKVNIFVYLEIVYLVF